MRVFVTGGAGFVGRCLVPHLVDQLGAAVCVYDNLSRSERTSVAAGATFVEADILDSAELRRTMSGCEVVFHLASEATVMGCELSPIRAADVNATGTANVLRTALETGVRRVIVASSREVYGDTPEIPVREDAPMRPRNVYGATKAAAEMYAIQASTQLEITTLRLSNVIGPGDKGRVLPNFIAAARANAPFTLYGGSQVLDFVSVDDVAAAMVRAGVGTYVPGAVNVGSGQGLTIRETASIVRSTMRSCSDLHVLPPREMEVQRFVADTTRLRCDMGIRPSTDARIEIRRICELSRPSRKSVEETPLVVEPRP